MAGAWKAAKNRSAAEAAVRSSQKWREGTFSVEEEEASARSDRSASPHHNRDASGRPKPSTPATGEEVAQGGSRGGSAAWSGERGLGGSAGWGGRSGKWSCGRGGAQGGRDSVARALLHRIAWCGCATLGCAALHCIILGCAIFTGRILGCALASGAPLSVAWLGVVNRGRVHGKVSAQGAQGESQHGQQRSGRVSLARQPQPTHETRSGRAGRPRTIDTGGGRRREAGR
eukprot:scaffold3806_cov94-Isochrysis_galbana.AAC.9